MFFISASSSPGDVVADFFMGSGSAITAAMKPDRRAIGAGLEPERFNQTVDEIRAVAEVIKTPVHRG